MTDRFIVPEPSDAAVEAACYPACGGALYAHQAMSALVAAYAVDLPAIVRSEVEAALDASAKQFEAMLAEFVEDDDHGITFKGAWRRDYLAARYGEPTPEPTCSCPSGYSGPGSLGRNINCPKCRPEELTKIPGTCCNCGCLNVPLAANSCPKCGAPRPEGAPEPEKGWLVESLPTYTNVERALLLALAEWLAHPDYAGTRRGDAARSLLSSEGA